MRAFLVAGLLAVAPTVAHASPLSELADSLEPGQWGELDTLEIDAVLAAGGASGIDFGYAEDIVWDPGSGRLFYMGGDHDDIANFITYSEESNTWETLPRPSWVGSNTMHAYDHSAIDTQRQLFYHRPFAANVVHRYDINADTWSSLPPPPDNGTSCCDALEFFPEMDSLIWAHHSYGELYAWNEDSGQWTLLDTLEAGSTWNVAEYNPVHELVIFAHAERLFQLTTDGSVTDLGQLGVPIYDGSGFTGVLTVDPVSGDYLVSTPATDGRTFHVFDVTQNAWAALPNEPPIDLTNSAMVATPVANYGVTLFTYCYGNTPCGVLLYKHSPFDIPPGTTGTTGTTGDDETSNGTEDEGDGTGSDAGTTTASDDGTAGPSEDGGSSDAGSGGCSCTHNRGGKPIRKPDMALILLLWIGFCARRRR